MRFVWLGLLVPTIAAAAPVVSIEDGGEKITLDADGTLTAGAASIQLKFDRPEGADKESKLRVVSLGGKRRGILLDSPTDGDEDPPDRHRVFLWDKKLTLVFDEVIDSPITFSPMGTGRYVESGWGACTRVKNKKEVKKKVFTLKLVGKKLVKTSKTSNEVQKCDELAACPFVYVDGRFVGEILRNVRYEPQLQSLFVGSGHVRITEEKPEITLIDELYIEVGGQRVHPAACDADPSLAYCAADGRYFVMNTGDTLDLDLPDGERTLFARGYYVPE